MFIQGLTNQVPGVLPWSLDDYRLLDQIWSCLLCGKRRAWGIGSRPVEVADYIPMLMCSGCGPTRHNYLGVARDLAP